MCQSRDVDACAMIKRTCEQKRAAPLAQDEALIESFLAWEE